MIRGIEKKLFLVCIALIVISLLLSACANHKNVNGEEGTENTEPVTIQIAMASEEVFHDRFDHINESLENIEIEYIPYDSTQEGLEELFAGDVYPDIINQNFHRIGLLYDYDIVEPLEDLMDKHGVDLDHLRPSSVAFIQDLGHGEMMGIPDGASHNALYYNKEIFDLFGEPYPDPEVPMTWEETFDLAKKLTGERNGVAYLGFQFHSGGGVGGAAEYILRQYALNLTDPDTGEVLVADDPDIREYFDTMERYFSIPGVPELDREGNLFPEQRVAMATWNNIALKNMDQQLIDKVDMAPTPVRPNYPDRGPYLSTYPLVIANYSENKDEAFQVLKAYMEPEHQLPAVRSGSAVSILEDPSVMEEYASEVPAYEGKNRDAWFALEPAIFEEHFSYWNQYVSIGDALAKMRDEGMDVNTVLRELKEESEVKIEDARAAFGE